MKKILLSLLSIFSFVVIGFSQVAIAEGEDALNKSKTTGEYVYIMPDEVDAEKVEKAASYYTSYFTVAFDDETNKAIVKMNPKAKNSRIIMARFLLSSGVREVKVDDKTLRMDEYINTHLK